MSNRFCIFFFFSSRRRHTRCSRDWSSDVCSSDLSWPSRPCEWRAKRLRGRPVSRTVTLRRARPSCRAPARPAKLPPMMMTSFMVMGSVLWLEGLAVDCAWARPVVESAASFRKVRRFMLGLDFLIFECGSDLLQIGEEHRPAFFPQDLNRGALGGFPSRHEFLNLFSAFGCNRQIHTIPAPAAICRYQTIPLQWLKIPHEGRALQPKAIA